MSLSKIDEKCGLLIWRPKAELWNVCDKDNKMLTFLVISLDGKYEASTLFIEEKIIKKILIRGCNTRLIFIPSLSLK